MPPSAENLRLAREDHALVVGIDRYPDFGLNGHSGDLRGPSQDALAVTDWLANYAGVPCQNIACMTSDGSGDCRVTNGGMQSWTPRQDPRPLGSDIERWLVNHVRESIRRSESGPPRIGRRLWVYMAGHGFASSLATRDVALLAADAARQIYVPNFCATKWVDWIAQTYPFDEVVLWLDCCASIRHGISLGVPPAQSVQARAKPAKRVVITAAMAGEESFEDLQDASGQARGLFTKGLLAGLSGHAETDDAGFITTQTLRKYLLNGGLSAGGSSGVAPVEVEPRFLEEQELKLVHVETRPPYTFHLGVAPGTVVRLYDGSNALVAELIADQDGAARLPLPPGIYRLHGGPIDSRLIQLAAGVGEHVWL